MLDGLTDQLDRVLSELYSHIDARDLDGISALRPRLTQICAGFRTVQQALGSPVVLGLPAERHGGDVIIHN
jgi:hypothetical protein